AAAQRHDRRITAESERQQLVAQLLPGAPILRRLAGGEGERAPPFGHRIAAAAIPGAPGGIGAVEIIPVEAGDGGVGNERRAAPAAVPAREGGELRQDPRLDVDRRLAAVVGDAEGGVHQVTSPRPSRWLARRARVKSRSESRFRYTRKSAGT